MVHINSSDEQSAIYNTIVSAGISPTYSPLIDGGGASYLWIGGTDLSYEGLWLWYGGSDSKAFWQGQGDDGAGDGHSIDGAYVNWGGTSEGKCHEPDDFNAYQDGAAIALSGWPVGTNSLGKAGEWNDISVENLIYYIIEYDPNSINDNNEKNKQNNNYTIETDTKNDKLILSGTLPINNISIHSIDGKVLNAGYNQNSSNKAIVDISNLASGVYFLIVQDTKQSCDCAEVC